MDIVDSPTYQLERERLLGLQPGLKSIIPSDQPQDGESLSPLTLDERRSLLSDASHGHHDLAIMVSCDGSLFVLQLTTRYAVQNLDHSLLKGEKGAIANHLYDGITNDFRVKTAVNYG